MGKWVRIWRMGMRRDRMENGNEERGGMKVWKIRDEGGGYGVWDLEEVWRIDRTGEGTEDGIWRRYGEGRV